jgi:hydroxypyruvate reductase
VLGRRIAAGCVNVKAGDPARCRRIELNPSGHPMPDSRGVRGAKRIAELARQASARDLVIGLISGGASALMPLPAKGISLTEKKAVTRQLLARGATIHEINTIRKHLSAIKGGQLARMAAPASVLSLILSDVVGDNPDVIGSGPTAPDSSTIGTATAVLRKYGVEQRVSPVETPKPGDPLFDHVENVIIGSNQKSLDAAAKKARSLGYRPLILSSTIEGETRDIARMHAAIAHQIRTAGQPVRPPVCVISGGETTVTIRGKGRGGRNQEFVLAAAMDIAGLEDVVVLSAGTDGTDGPTTAAGAIADGSTITRSKLDARAALARNDSHTFFAALNDLIVTGPTGTNVMDIRVLLIR